jgi:hypothetical protein
MHSARTHWPKRPVDPADYGFARRMSGYGTDDNDAYLDSDIGYPNRRAQYRGHRVLIFFILVAGLVALIGGMIQGTEEIARAFPTLSSLAQADAWMTFLSGTGRIAAVGLIAVLFALVWRWRIRRRRR